MDTDLGQEDHAGAEDECPNELDGDRNAPCGVAVTVLGCVVDDGRQQETDGDGPLVACDDGTSDPLGGTLGLVHGDEGRDEADTQTSEDTADDKGRYVGGACLESDTEGKDET